MLIEMDQALLDEAMKDTNMARKLCLYHGTQGRLLSNQIKHNQASLVNIY